MKYFLYYILGAILMGLLLNESLINRDKQIENLNKQIELLECYKENYLIMADSLDGIHNACFKIGK